MSAAAASVTPQFALASFASSARASGFVSVIVGLVVLGLISSGAVAG
jgi:hypothetical protein